MNAPSSVPPPLAVSPAGVSPNLRYAFGGIWRIAWRRAFAPKSVLIILGLAVALALLAAVSVSTGDSNHYLHWVTEFYLLTLVPIIAFVSGGGAIREDMKSGVVDYLLTRPVPRPFFVVARYVCQLVCVQAACLVSLVAVLGAGVYRAITGLADVWPLLLVAQIAAITAFTALGFLAGAISRRYLVLGLLYAGIIEVGLGRIPIHLNKLSMLQHLQAMLEAVAPSPGSSAMDAQGPWLTIMVLAGFALVWLLAAAVIFSLQEFAGEQPKEA